MCCLIRMSCQKLPDIEPSGARLCTHNATYQRRSGSSRWGAMLTDTGGDALLGGASFSLTMLRQPYVKRSPNC
jgi:hypothetical protein